MRQTNKVFVSITLTVSIIFIVLYINIRFAHQKVDEKVLNQYVDSQDINNEVYILKAIENKIENPVQNSKFAYVTLISGIDSSMKYRGFLYNSLIMKKSLANLGSSADFVALIGYSERNTNLFQQDIDLLKYNGIIVHELPRFINESYKLTFAEMALLKITPWSFTHYDRIQFLDGDVMPTQSMDCFFQLNQNTFTVGAASPLNSGWYLAVPTKRIYEYLRLKAIWRLNCDWDEKLGWEESLDSFNLTYRGGSRKVEKWDFNGADMDQGLFVHYFVLNFGNALLIDTDSQSVRKFVKGLKYEPDEKLKVDDISTSCKSLVPTSYFAHFTGRSKPWVPPDKKSSNKKSNLYIMKWMELLDDLRLSVNSSNVQQLGLGSPLGYFNTDMFKKKKEKCAIV
jgi:hypothetical protein